MGKIAKWLVMKLGPRIESLSVKNLFEFVEQIENVNIDIDDYKIISSLHVKQLVGCFK